MLVKLTSKNQLTLPKAVIEAMGTTEYFDVETRNGVIILTPVRIQRGDAVRAELAKLDLSQTDLDDAVVWVRGRVAKPPASYAVTRTPRKPATPAPARKNRATRRKD